MSEERDQGDKKERKRPRRRSKDKKVKRGRNSE